MDLSKEDEFEFKPLTEGLGFHGRKQKEKLMAQTFQEPVVSSTPKATRAGAEATAKPSSSNPLPMATPDMLQDLVKPEPTNLVKNPHIPQRSPVSGPATEPSVAKKVLEDLKKKRESLSFVEPSPVRWENSVPNFSAMLLDFLLVMASSLALVISTVMAAQIDLVFWLNHSSWTEKIFVAYVFVGVISWLYLFIFRYFFGRTPGEWTTDQIMETNAKGVMAILCLAWRALLSPLTGFITLPLISMLVAKQDVAGYITGCWLKKEHLK